MTKLAVRPDEAAAMLSVSRDYFDQHVKPNIACVRVGRAVIVPVHELDRWIRSEAVNVSKL